jgi:putative ABC transport system permease protein
MRISDSLTIAIRGLRHAGMRSALTMLGIVIGISSVILLMSVGASSQDLILGQVRGIGTNVVFVIPGGSGSSRFQSPQSTFGIVVKTLTERDVDALRREPSIRNATGQVNGSARIVFENNDVQITYAGVDGSYHDIYNVPAASGAWFTATDVESLNHVAVLGSTIAHTLFGERAPLGRTVRIKDVSFRVVGVLEKKGIGPGGADLDNTVYLPLTVGQKQLLGINYYNWLLLRVNDQFDVSFAKSRIASVLRTNHHVVDPSKDDFTIRSQEDALALLGSITSVMALFLTSIACISLVVGGIGIMNIMLVSVVERTREIGLRKAIGAADGDIMSQFLWEAVMLTTSGGIVGIVIGAGLTALAYVAITQLAGLAWHFILPSSAIILAVIVSTATGLIFGIYPARKAARKNPIEALRYE